MWRCLILIVSVTCQLFSCMPVQKKYYSKRKAWSYYTLFASAGNASMVVTTSITSTHGRVGTMDKNRLRLNKRSRWPRTPWIQNQEFVPSFILQMYRTSSFWSHCPHLVPATCQDDGPATLGDVSLARVDADKKRQTALSSATAAAACQAVVIMCMGWHVTHAWWFPDPSHVQVLI